MDQDSSNGAGADKRNWRERLGIGAKELPKLSDEFRDEPQAAPPPAAGTAKPAPRAPQPVTKPAPMAPRVAAKPAQPAPEPAAPPPAAPVSRATPKAPDNATQDALAEKLRAQRAAAERLAEQRVQAARNRAEANKPKPEAPPPPAPRTAAPLPRPAAPPPRPAVPSPRAAAPAAPASRSVTSPAPPSGTARPKFSFADDSRGEQPTRSGMGSTPAPLTPPRPALGGERGQPPFLRPTTTANGSLGARPQPTFRPPSSEGSGYVPAPRLQPPSAPRPGLGSEAAGYGTARVPARRPPALDTYARQPEPRDYPEDDYQDEGRAVPRLGRPGVAGRSRAPQDDFDEVFEDEQAPRARSSARDYDGDDAFADEPRRSRGPWLLLLALFGAAMLMVTVYWLYSGGSIRNLTDGGATSGSTPVIPAPSEPSKVAAPDVSGGEGQTEAPARKKQIYDRIVGEQEVTGEGQMQPTEETPVPPSDAAPADQVPKIEPSGSSNAIPAPDAPDQGAAGQGLPEVEPPPPLPLPGSDQQGNLGLKGGSQVAAASAAPEQGSTAPPLLPSPTTQTSSSDATTPPPPEKATDGAASFSTQGSGANQSGTTSASVMPEPEPQPEPPAPPISQKPAAQSASKPAANAPAAAAAPAKKKTQTAKKKATQQQPDYDNLGSAPVVLVPPSKQAMAESQASPPPVATSPTQAQQPAANAPAAAATKRKSIFDLFNGSGGSASGQTAAQAPAAAPTQVASAAPQTKPAAPPVTQKAAPPPAQPQAAASGYVVQLASFRSEAEAKQEYARLAKSYPSVVNPLRSQVRQTTVGGSTRYQLGLGPLPTRGDATRVCGELIAAGESDCIVRGP